MTRLAGIPGKGSNAPSRIRPSRLQATSEGETAPTTTSAAALVAPAASKIQIRRAPSNIVRRVISDEQWTDQVTPSLERGATVTVWRAGEAFVVRLEGGALQVKGSYGPKFMKLTDQMLTKLKATCTLTPEHVTKDPVYSQSKNDGDGFSVTEFADEPLSFVHHTESTGTEKAQHLTVENAHVLAFEDMFNSQERDVRDKSKLKKPDVNAALGGTYSTGSVDNLNFYPPEKQGKKKGKKKGKKGDEPGPHAQLPLSRYMAFLAHAMTIGGAPPEYGQKMLAFVGEMATVRKLDPSQLFMRVGMDEAAFARAVLIIDSQLPSDAKLAISKETRAIFERWWNITGNEDPVPYLPAPDAVDGEPLIRSGAPYKSKTWGTIEGDYCKEHFAEFVRAINDFTPDAAVAAKVGGKKATN